MRRFFFFGISALRKKDVGGRFLPLSHVAAAKRGDVLRADECWRYMIRLVCKC